MLYENEKQTKKQQPSSISKFEKCKINVIIVFSRLIRHSQNAVIHFVQQKWMEISNIP